MDKMILCTEQDLINLVERAVENVLNRKQQKSSSELKSPATKKEATNFLRISLPTLDRLIKSEQIKTLKIGTSVRIHWQELEGYVNKKGLRS